MLKPSLFLVAGLLVGFALSAWLRVSAPDARRLARGDAELANRVGALEDALHDERDRVVALAAQVSELRARLLPASGHGDESAAGDESGGAAANAGPFAAAGRAASGSRGPNGAAAGADADEDGVAVRGPFGGRRGFGASGESRVDRFVAAGFSADRAAYLDRRASELRMQALEAEYEAARSGKPADAAALPNPEQALREELGDTDYERYLQALGRPTRVGVRGVLASSPAERAGLQPGDEITSYAGQRVFDVRDLNRLIYEGRAGEAVALDIVRNGQPMQIYVPRGPLGITGRGRFGGGP